MAHYAQIDENNLVTQVIVVNNETINNLEFPDSEPVGVAFCQSLFGGDTNWKQTSYNVKFRKNYAGIGHTFDAALDAFIPPQPYASWTFDASICNWVPPTPCPDDEKLYYWDEGSVAWVEKTLSV